MHSSPLCYVLGQEVMPFLGLAHLFHPCRYCSSIPLIVNGRLFVIHVCDYSARGQHFPSPALRADAVRI